jgi:putative ABC transport system permease protein
MSRSVPAIRFYRGLLWLYPAEFRDHFEREMCRTFADIWRENDGIAALLPLFLGILIDAPKEHYHMIRQDLVYALRSMRRDRTSTAVAAAVLALGIGSIATVFTLLDGMLLRPLPYPDQKSLVYVEEYRPRELEAAVAYPNYLDFRAGNRTLAELAIFTSGLSTLRGDFEAERVPAAAATPSLFRVLRIEPILGRVFNDADDLPKAPPVVLLGEDLWRRRYGADPAIVGKKITVGSDPTEVVGVMPRGFRFPERAQFWTPLQGDPKVNRRTDHGWEVVARLRPGVTTGQAQTDLRGIMDQITREHPTETYRQTVNVFPYRDRDTQQLRPALATLAGAVIFVLLIACANVANLLLVKASARAREIAVRSALGASRARLVRQLVVESLLLGALGAVGGALLAWAAVPGLLSLTPPNYLPVWMRFTPDLAVLGFVALVSAGTAVAAGIVPALSASRLEIVETLKEGGRSNSSGRSSSWLRSSMVVAEIAMSVLLLAGAGLMVRSFVILQSQQLGYRTGDIVTLRTSAPETRYPQGEEPSRELVRTVVREFRAVPGVVSAAGASSIPLTNNWGRSFTVEGAPLLSLKDAPLINHIVVTPGYFQTLGIPILEGRDFDERDAKTPGVSIVDEGIARRYWPHESAIGKRVRYGPPEDNEPWHTVIGVVGTSRNQTLREPRRNTVYLPNGEFGFASLAYMVRTTPGLADPTSTLRARLATIDRSIAMSQVQTLRQIVDASAWQERFLATVFAGFGILALVLAVVGLYGVISYAVSRRTHEMGIRMALGASAGEIRRMVLVQSGRLLAIGLAIGVVGAVFLTRLLRAQLFAVSPGDPATLATVTALLAAAAMAASYFPARKATRVDPMTALRDE